MGSDGSRILTMDIVILNDFYVTLRLCFKFLGRVE